MAYEWRSKDNLLDSALSFHHLLGIKLRDLDLAARPFTSEASHENQGKFANVDT